MNKETRERIELAKKRIREQSPTFEEKRTIRPRAKYRRGVKNYLSSFNVGETKEYTEEFRWNSLRSVSCKLKNDFGCQFLFNTKFGKRFITRVK